MINKIYEKIKKYIVENYKFLLAIVFIIFIFNFELSYVIYKPGGSINLNKRIEVENAYQSKGSFEMAYVSLVKGNIPFLLLSYVIPNWDIYPASDVTGGDESIDDALKKDKISLEEAIDNATIAAYNLANKKIDITAIKNNVTYITDEADTTILEYDQIISIEGTLVSSLEDMKKIVNSYNENDVLKLKVLRNGKEKDVTAKVYNTEGGLKIGVSIINTYDFKTDPKISVKTKRSESGPSGGLITALSIYNSLTKNDITKGRKIVGTGTITKDGVVGEIGGVKYKLMGAVKNKADIFMCPKANYEEAKTVAKENNYDIKIMAVETLNEAIFALKNS